jgi:hypothetical protein
MTGKQYDLPVLERFKASNREYRGQIHLAILYMLSLRFPRPSFGPLI